MLVGDFDAQLKAALNGPLSPRHSNLLGIEFIVTVAI